MTPVRETRSLPEGLPSLSPHIAGLFPQGVVAAELWGAADAAALHPDEKRCCDGFSPKRRADFAAGRACAGRALREFGYDAFPLVRNVDRRPRWPQDVVGSISHTIGFCGAAIGRTAHFESLGFDAEVIGGVEEELWATLFSPEEREKLLSLEVAEQATVATILFSAKEAYYKCHFGLRASWLDFTDVVVTLEPGPGQTGEFVVAASAQGRTANPATRAGRYAIVGRFVLTGIADLRSDAFPKL